MHHKRNDSVWYRKILVAILLCTLLLSGTLLVGQAQEEVTQSDDELLAELETNTDGNLVTSQHRVNGKYAMIRATFDTVLYAGDTTASPADRAVAFLDRYGQLMGTTSPGSELEVAEVFQDEIGMQHVRFNQLHNGVPVFGAELLVHMNDGGITAVNGRFVPVDEGLSVEPGLTAEEAGLLAHDILAKDTTTITVESTVLSVYRDGLLKGVEGEDHLAWGVEVAGATQREQIWLDAHSGLTLNRISERHEDLNRIVYSPQYDPQNPDRYIVREEGDPPTGITAFDNLYRFSGQVYNFFDNAFGRDSYDGNGITMRTVYLVNQYCPNAYWNGQATNYCPGFDLDDVVAHEWGHAYTEYTHGLIYQWQSGALNESYSDIWGEAIDLHNSEDGVGGSNNDQPYPDGQRWLMGEDLPIVHELFLRDMWDPERMGYPSKVSSDQYYCESGDNGGVHYNSGVPNHAFAMLVDGKQYNGETVEGIGFNTAAHIYWRAAAVYQNPTTNFAHHADSLEAACHDLLGQKLRDFRTGEATGDRVTGKICKQVRTAMEAVEMRREPTQCNYQPVLDPNTPEMCSSPSYVLQEDWEDGMSGWTLTSEGTGDSWPGYEWVLDDTLPGDRAGNGVFAIDEVAGTCAPGGDISGHFTLDSPTFTAPDSLTGFELRFDHYVATELNWDGGNLKASINGAPYQVVPEDAYTFNAPNTTLNSSVDGNTNPLAGQIAWSGTDEGKAGGSWGTTVVDLNALSVSPGDSIQLRWDFGIDGCNGVEGWYMDDVDVLTCSQ